MASQRARKNLLSFCSQLFLFAYSAPFFNIFGVFLPLLTLAKLATESVFMLPFLFFVPLSPTRPPSSPCRRLTILLALAHPLSAGTLPISDAYLPPYTVNEIYPVFFFSSPLPLKPDLIYIIGGISLPSRVVRLTVAAIPLSALWECAPYIINL